MLWCRRHRSGRGQSAASGTIEHAWR